MCAEKKMFQNRELLEATDRLFRFNRVLVVRGADVKIEGLQGSASLVEKCYYLADLDIEYPTLVAKYPGA